MQQRLIFHVDVNSAFLSWEAARRVAAGEPDLRAIPSAIGNEVFVTYIGIGLPVDTPSLGNLIQTGRSLMTVASLRYQLFFPVAVLVVITVSFYIIGNAFADAADPKNHVR